MFGDNFVSPPMIYIIVTLNCVYVAKGTLLSKVVNQIICRTTLRFTPMSRWATNSFHIDLWNLSFAL